MELEIVEVEPSIEVFEIFRNVFKGAFAMDYSIERFSWTYLSKYSQGSKIVLIRSGLRVLGVRGLWKLRGLKSYQLIDTCVLPEARGQGLFAQSNIYISSNYSVYNLPNGMSRPGYLRDGWVIASRIGIVPLPIKHSLPQFYEYDYLVWRFVQCPDRQYFIKKHGNCYSILAIKRGLIPVLIARTKHKLNLPYYYGPVLLGYSTGKRKYLKTTGMILCNDNEIVKYHPIYFDMI